MSIKDNLEKNRSSIEIDFRPADDNTMLSYFHISPSGKMLLVVGNQYKDIGDYLLCNDLYDLLIDNNFNFETHKNRHFRDI